MDYSLTIKLLEGILGTPNEIWKNYYIRFLNSRKQTSKQEVHHIIPVSLLEKDSYLIKDPCNLISLTFREHFIAHLILYKMYPNCRKLVAAAYFIVLKELRMLGKFSYKTLTGIKHTQKKLKQLLLQKKNVNTKER